MKFLQLPLTEPEILRFAGNIERESDRMQSLIDRLLQLARLEKKPQLDALELICVKTMVESVVAAADAKLTAKTLQCHILVDDQFW